ncbi:secreted protein [Candidatus Thiomargarita nelsonii]|uniref:Secreted protein n=1 Tax=Candidatus Thiomargarita nelsonii TaxID=1003181 RepID=A0A176RZQ1_9GAMM|nr:secreted protein [Candidatus Thiomargarita nelsonii]
MIKQTLLILLTSLVLSACVSEDIQNPPLSLEKGEKGLERVPPPPWGGENPLYLWSKS